MVPSTPYSSNPTACGGIHGFPSRSQDLILCSGPRRDDEKVFSNWLLERKDLFISLTFIAYRRTLMFFVEWIAIFLANLLHFLCLKYHLKYDVISNKYWLLMHWLNRFHSLQEARQCISLTVNYWCNVWFNYVWFNEIDISWGWSSAISIQNVRNYKSRKRYFI